MKKIFNKLKKRDPNNIFKGMLTLAVGASAGKALGLASIPIVTRIYSPEDFGILALFSAFVVMLVPFASLKYSTAIPLPKTDAIAINVLALCLLITIVFSIIIGIQLLLFSEIILAWFNATELAKWWWLIILAVIGSATYETLSLWSIRKKQYKAIAKTQFIQSLIGNSAKIFLGLAGLKPFGLIFGQFLAQSSGTNYLIKNSIVTLKKNYSSISLKRIKMVAINYREFAYFRFPSQFLLSISAQAPILITATIFSKEATGQFSLAMLAVAIPTGLVSNAVANAFYAEIASIGKRDPSKIKKLTINVQKKLFLIGIPLTIFVMLIAKPIFILIFGKEWSDAGQYAGILAPFILLQFTSKPLIQVLNILGSQLIFLIINIIRILGLAIIFYMVKYIFHISLENFVVIISTYLTIYYLIMTLFIIFMVNKSISSRN